MRIILIGAYPPPYGGVSIHIQRLHDLLLNSGFQCIVIHFSSSFKNSETVVNARKISSWRYVLNNSYGIVHIHSSGINLKKIVGFFLVFMLCKIRKNKFIVTFHSFREDVRHFGFFEKIMFKTFFNSVSRIIAVSSLIKNKLIFLGVDSNKILVIPAFLPPALKQNDIDEIPQEIWNFVNDHKPLISANAFRISFHKGQDLYGVDMCVDLCAKLRSTYPRIGFIFSLSEIGDLGYFDRIKQKIVQEGIADNFLFLTRSCQFYPILMKSDLLVRPTNTDGDAISVREALYFKIPTVASDVVPRPRGVILFKNRDINDFISKVEDVLRNHELYKKRLEALEIEDNFQKILDVYQQLNTHAK